MWRSVHSCYFSFIKEVISLKQSVQTVDPMQQLQEVEVPASRSGIREGLIEASDRHDVLWVISLWENRRFLWLCTLRGLIVVTLIAFAIPNRYESTVRLMPPEKGMNPAMGLLAAVTGGGGESGGSTVTGGSDALMDIASDLVGSKTQAALFAEMLRSRTVADRLIARFDLRKVYWTRYWERARKKLASNTQISEDRKTGVITIQVTDRKPVRAAQMAQAYVEELDHLVAQVSTSSARRQRIFLEQRLKTAKQELEDASKQFSEYASQNTAIDVPEQGKAMVAAAAVLQGQLIAAKSELEGLEQIYTGNNVRVRSLRARVDELNRQLEKLGGGDDTSIYSASDDPINGSSGPSHLESPELYPSIRKLPLLGVRWLDLYRETKMREIVYALLTQQYEMARVEEAKEIPTVSVLDAANVPEKNAGPPRIVIIIVGTALAFSGGVVWILGVGVWNEMEPGDPRKQLMEEIGSRAAEFSSKCVAGGREIARRLWLRKRDSGSFGASD